MASKNEPTKVQAATAEPDVPPEVPPEGLPEVPPEVPPEMAEPPESDKEYTVKAGCAIEHAGIRYEGSADDPVKVKLTAEEAEVHKANLES